MTNQNNHKDKTNHNNNNHKDKKNHTQKNYKNAASVFKSKGQYSSPRQKENHAPVQEHKIIGQCLFCGTGVSNTSYSIEYEQQPIHFECCLKKAREIMTADLSFSKKYKVMYLGSSTFALYNEKGGPFQWEILKKITLKEIMNQKKSS